MKEAKENQNKKVTMNEKLKTYFPNPPIYISTSYLEYRDQYRKKIGDITIHPNDETWNQWLNFNFNRFEDQLYYMEAKLKSYSKSLEMN